MPAYNVLAAVVELIDADTESEAKDIFRHRLENAGFDVYDDQPIDAFESEDLS